MARETAEAEEKFVMTEEEKDDLIEILTEILRRSGIDEKKSEELFTKIFKMIEKKVKDETGKNETIEEIIQRLLSKKLTQLMNETKDNNSKILIGAIIKNKNIAEEIVKTADETFKTLRKTYETNLEIAKLKKELINLQRELQSYISETETNEISKESIGELKKPIKQTEEKIEKLQKQIKGKVTMTEEDLETIKSLLRQIKCKKFWKKFFSLSHHTGNSEFTLKRCSCGGLIITESYTIYDHQFPQNDLDCENSFCIHCGYVE